MITMFSRRWQRLIYEFVFSVVVKKVMLMEQQETVSLLDGKHAALVKAYTQHCIDKGFSLVEHEAHFNYYNNRGFLDVLAKKEVPGGFAWIAAECKATLSDLGATLRQIRNAKAYFMKGRPELFDPKLKHVVRFPVVIASTEENFRLWREYSDSFRDVEVVFLPVDDSAGANAALHKFEIDSAIFRARRRE